MTRHARQVSGEYSLTQTPPRDREREPSACGAAELAEVGARVLGRRRRAVVRGSHLKIFDNIYLQKAPDLDHNQ